MGFKYLTKEQAEKRSKVKLDGRRKYFMWDGLVCVAESYTIACSGCTDDSEYSCARIGSGCHECGYTGKRRCNFPCPVNPKQVK
jgi:hypothetical protein